jgi:hypothetical protein
MKYTFESSETEVTELYGLIGLIAKEVGKTVRHANELRAHTRHGSGTLSTSAVPPLHVVSDSDGESADADVIEFPRPSARKTEQQIEDEIVNEPEPLPADVVKQAKAEKKGRDSFTGFIQDWLVGIDPETMALIEGIVQPDRAQMLRDLQNGPHAYNLLIFVKKCGGLQRAIKEVTGSESLALALAPFIVPPASIAFSDLADTYEYTNPFVKDED